MAAARAGVRRPVTACEARLRLGQVHQHRERQARRGPFGSPAGSRGLRAALRATPKRGRSACAQTPAALGDAWRGRGRAVAAVADWGSPALNSYARPHLHRDWGSSCPHLHRDWSPPRPHLHRDWSSPHARTEAGRAQRATACGGEACRQRAGRLLGGVSVRFVVQQAHFTRDARDPLARHGKLHLRQQTAAADIPLAGRAPPLRSCYGRVAPE